MPSNLLLCWKTITGLYQDSSPFLLVFAHLLPLKAGLVGLRMLKVVELDEVQRLLSNLIFIIKNFFIKTWPKQAAP